MMKTAAPPARPRNGETLDTFHRGRVRVLQKKRGYRFSADAPLLADFIRTRRADDILEIGTGSGIIPLLLRARPFRRITALEIQKGLANLAGRNLELNGMTGRVRVVVTDFRAYRPKRKFDLVFSNPPYVRKSTGFLSSTAEKSVAKHEIRGDLGDLMRKTSEWLKQNGRAGFIYPEGRRDDLLRAAEANGLHLRRSRSVHPRAGGPANFFLAELGFAKGKPKAQPPLVLFNRAGRYTKEAEAIFAGRPQI
jgi:tRNA1(Val) A37 N6-methylase TrmN6